ncbi:MAG: threonylcarbamoyl-AMP synthase [Bacteroidetes bacterium]|nr:threonylcarbamoyl-AMP synthase [Bacteroidota bacterium]
MWSDADLNNALTALRQGGTIAYPTDTVWGIGCDACNEQAVAKVNEIKNRPENKGYVVLVSDIDMLIKYIDAIPGPAIDILKYNTKPLTIIYDKCFYIAENAIYPDGSIAIRICEDSFCKALIKKLRKPLLSTSANISNEPAPSIFKEISETILSRVDYVVKYKQNDNKKAAPSTIMKISANGTFQIIRK